jgi:tRNA A-37 threonylcarbamoyl transferase component Bud32
MLCNLCFWRESNHLLSSELVDAVDRLHLHGVSHGDLYERNILSHDGRPILIDIEKMQTHSCGRRMIVLQGAIAPTVEEFGCPELHDFIMRCGLWSSSRFFVRLGHVILIFM